MKGIDHTNTKVLIIGVSEFPEDKSLHPIPNVLANIELLQATLTDPTLVGIPAENIIVSINEDSRKIRIKLRNISEETRTRRHTLVVYYTGHGILSSRDRKLYFSTHETGMQNLEIDAVPFDTVKQYVKDSAAGRKIVILDCCHSGAFIENSMSSMSSVIQSNLESFSGTYIMTSAPSDSVAMFSAADPHIPTYFTGKLVEVFKEGVDNENPFCTLRDVYEQIEDDFQVKGLPKPQQANFNNVDQLLFFKNRKYRPEDEVGWEEAVEANNKWGYHDFLDNFPESKFAPEAKKRIFELDELESWNDAERKNTLSGFMGHLENYPNGKFRTDARNRITEIRNLEEESFWNRIAESSEVKMFTSYLEKYPRGVYREKAREAIVELRDKQHLAEQEQAAEMQKKARAESEKEKLLREAEANRIAEEQRQRSAKEEEEKRRLAIKKRQDEEEAERRKQEAIAAKKLEDEKNAKRLADDIAAKQRKKQEEDHLARLAAADAKKRKDEEEAEKMKVAEIAATKRREVELKEKARKEAEELLLAEQEKAAEEQRRLDLAEAERRWIADMEEKQRKATQEALDKKRQVKEEQKRKDAEDARNREIAAAAEAARLAEINMANLKNKKEVFAITEDIHKPDNSNNNLVRLAIIAIAVVIIILLAYFVSTRL